MLRVGSCSTNEAGREKAAPFLCGAGSVPAAMAWCNVPCFPSALSREPKRLCCGFQACFDTNRGWEPGEAQETISEHRKQPRPSSAEGGFRSVPQMRDQWQGYKQGLRVLDTGPHLCGVTSATMPRSAGRSREVGAPLSRHCARHPEGSAHTPCPLPGSRRCLQRGVCYLATG